MKVKNEFKAGVLVLIAGLLLFSMIAIFAGQGFQNDGSKFSELQVRDFRTDGFAAESQVSEQKEVVSGSRVSELENGKSDDGKDAGGFINDLGSRLAVLESKKSEKSFVLGLEDGNSTDGGTDGSEFLSKTFKLFNIIPYAYALTADEERQQLEAELQNLTQQLINLGYNPDDICSVNQIKYFNYNCDNQIGYHTVKVLTAGIHNQRFNFSNQIADAHNLASVANVSTNGSVNQFIDDTDTDFLKGNLTTGLNLITSRVVGTGAGANVTINISSLLNQTQNMQQRGISVNASTVLYLRFEEGTGQYANDSGFYQANNGTLGGAAGGDTSEPVWNSTTKFGSFGLTFDGINDLVNVSDSATLNFAGGSITVEAWIYPRNITRNRNVVAKRQDSAAEREFNLGIDDGILQWQIWNGAGTSTSTRVQASEHIRIDEWTHFAGTYDGSFLRMYVNGIAVNITPSTITLGNTPQPIIIGCLFGVDCFNGTIDEVAVWNVTLDNATILQHYQLGWGYFNTSNFTSQVFDANAIVNWSYIAWQTAGAYQKEIGRADGDGFSITDDSLVDVVELDGENYSMSNNALTSSVEKISTSDCSLNLFSLDQIAQSEDKANAKYGISLVCPGSSFKAPDSNFLNSARGTTSMISDNNVKEIMNSKPPIPENLQIFCFNKYNSSSAKSGTISLAPLRYTDFSNVLVYESGLKNENKMLASTIINLICQADNYEAEYLLARLSLYSSTSFEKSSSESLLSFNMSFTTLNKTNTLSFSSTALLNKTFVSGVSSSSPISLLNLSGISTFSSAISSSQKSDYENEYLKLLVNNNPKIKKVKIKDIKPGQYVLSLDEKTGKLKPAKVNALLDHGIKPIYEMATEDGRAINTTAEHPYLVKLHDKKACDKLSGDVWNKAYQKEESADDFESKGYCTRWVEVKYLQEGMEIAVPRIEKDYLESKSSSSFSLSEFSSNLRNSSVLSTLTFDCRLCNFSLDHRVQSNFSANAKKSTSFKCSGNIDLALPKKSIYSDSPTNSASSGRISISSVNSLAPILDANNISSLCLLNSLNANCGDIKSMSLDIANCNNLCVGEFFQKKEYKIFVSTTNLSPIQINPCLLSCFNLSSLTLALNLSTSSSVNSLLLNISSNLLNASFLLSFLRNDSLATSDQLIHENLFNSALISSDIVNVTDAIYSSPLFFNSSNFFNSSSLLSMPCLMTSFQSTSGNLLLAFSNSSGNDTVIVVILLPPFNSVNILKSVDIYKSLGFDVNSAFVSNSSYYVSKHAEQVKSVLEQDLGIAGSGISEQQVPDLRITGPGFENKNENKKPRISELSMPRISELEMRENGGDGGELRSVEGLENDFNDLGVEGDENGAVLNLKDENSRNWRGNGGQWLDNKIKYNDVVFRKIESIRTEENKEKKKSLNQEETVLAESVYNVNNYLNVKNAQIEIKEKTEFPNQIQHTEPVVSPRLETIKEDVYINVAVLGDKTSKAGEMSEREASSRMSLAQSGTATDSESVSVHDLRVRNLGFESKSEDPSSSAQITSDIVFKKIKRIKTLEAQHVYDLSIEGTQNFVANGIIAHNTAAKESPYINTTGLVLLMHFNNETGESERQLNETHNISAETNLVLYMPFDSANARELTPNGSTVLLMHFNNDTGTGENASLFLSNATDSTGLNLNNGTCNLASSLCPVFNMSNAKFGAAGLEFDGVNDHINVSDSASLDAIGSVTLEAWVKPNALSGGMEIAGKQRPADTDGAYHLTIDGGSPFMFRTFTTAAVEILSSTKAQIGVWQHVAGVYDGSRQRIYVNGVLQGDVAQSGSLTNSAEKFIIGGRAHWSPQSMFFNGTIDEVAVWNISLSSEIIAKHSGYGIDKSIYGNNASLMLNTTVNQTGCKFNECMAFVDKGSVANENIINITPNKMFSFGTGGFAIEAWGKTTTCSGGGGNDEIIRIANSSGSQIVLKRDNGASAGLQFYIEGSNNQLNGKARICDDNWHHIATTRSGNLFTLYVDGVQDGTVTSALAAPANITLVRIGGDDNWNGSIDELAVWNISLSSDKISEHAGAKIIDYSGQCYDNKTEILTKTDKGIEWKLFSGLNGSEEVRTLNPVTKQAEWQKPTAYQTFEHKDFMYNITTGSGNLLVSPKHKVYGAVLPNRIYSASDGDKTLTFDCFLSPLSPESTGQLSFNAKARYGASLKFNSIASGNLSKNSEEEIRLISLLMNENISDNSSFVNLLCDSNLSILLPSSKNKNSGAIKSNTLKILLDSNTSNGLPLLTKAEKTEFASTTNSMNYLPLDFNSFSYLSANDKLTSSANSLACSSVNLDLSTILLILANSSSSSFRRFSIANCQFMPEAFSNSFNSSGISTFNSAILSSLRANNENDYLNVSDFELMQISDVYEELKNDSSKQLVFLDAQMNEIVVKSITKEAYDGKIYDVDVPNDIVLVRRKEPLANSSILSTSAELDLSRAMWSGNSNNGTRNFNSTSDFGRNFTDGKFGKGLVFDGVNDYINVSDSGNWDFGSNDFAIEAWVYAKGQPTRGIIVSRWGGGATTTKAWQLYHASCGAGTVSYSFQASDDGSNEIISMCSDAPTPNSWNHVAVTRKGSTFTIYRDGVAKNIASSAAAIFNNNLHITIGIDPRLAQDSRLNGTLDELSIWNVSLSADEIRKHYERGVLKLNLSYRNSQDNVTWTAWTPAVNNNTLSPITGFSIADDSLVDVVEGVIVKKDSHPATSILNPLDFSVLTLNNLDTSKSSSFNVIKNPSKSSGFDFFLSSLENAGINASGLSCGITTKIMENTLSFGNSNGLRKSESLVTMMRPSALETSASLESGKLFGAKTTSNSSDSRNLPTRILTFSSSRNLSSERDADCSNVSTSCNISSIMQGSLDVCLGQGREVINNLVNGHASFKHLQNLPYHDSGALESGLSVADFAVRYDVLADFDSHAAYNENGVFKGIGNNAYSGYSTIPIKEFEKICPSLDCIDAENYAWHNDLIGVIMVPEPVENDSVFFNLEHQDKASNMDSLVLAKASPEILEMLNRRGIETGNLIDIGLDGPEQNRISSLKLRESLFNKRSVNLHNFSHSSLNSSMVIAFLLPDLRSLDTFSTEFTNSLKTDSLTSRVSSSSISDIPRTFLRSCNSSMSFSASENACLATEDQFIQSVLDIFSFNSSGTDNVIVPILDLQSNYLYYVQTKDIFKDFYFETKKVKIKDIKEGDYVQSLDESTGKLVPRKVNALLDHGIKPIRELKTISGRAVNTTAEHPYLVKLYSKEECDRYADTFWNKNNDIEDDFEKDGDCTRWIEVKDLKEGMGIAVPRIKNADNHPIPNNFLSSDVENTLTLPCCLCLFSSDHKINSSDDNVKAKYGASLEWCGNISNASGRNLEYLDSGITSIFLNKRLIKNSSSVFVSPEYLNNRSSRLVISFDMNSGEYSLIPALDNLFINLNINPLLINAWNTMFASTTSIISENQDMPCLLAMPSLASSANLNACFFVNLLLDRIPSANENSTSSINSFTTLFNAALNSSFNSGEISTFTTTSAISLSPEGNNKIEYLNVLKYNKNVPGLLESNASERERTRSHVTVKSSLKTLEVPSVLPQDEASLLSEDKPGQGTIDNIYNERFKSFANSDIIFEKITSIKALDEQHVYDLAIEGTQNFIANDIVAHNTARFFQYKADFNTTDAKYSPILNNVSINYSLRSNLTIFDDTDFRAIYTRQLINFTANFTDFVNPINGTNINCTLSHNATGSYGAPIKMAYDASSKVYFYNTTFTSALYGNFNVTCDGTVLGYQLMKAIDDFTINSSLIALNKNFTIPAYPIFNRNATIVANVTDQNNNIAYVNFTLYAPNGSIINLTNSSKGAGASADMYNASFNLTNYGTWTWNVSVTDADGFIVNMTGTGIITLMQITENLNVTTAIVSAPVAVSGRVNLSNGTNVSNNLIRIFFNDVLMGLNNLTGYGIYKPKQFIDANDTDFNAGALLNVTAVGTGALANLTLKSNITNGQSYPNQTGNFTSQTFDAGAVANWSYINWNDVANNKYGQDLGDSINASMVLYMKFNNDTLESERQLNVTHNISAETNLVLYMPFDSASARELTPNGSTVLLMHFNNDTTTGENASLFYDNSTYGNNGTCRLDLSRCPVFNASNARLGNAALEFDGIDDLINKSDENIIESTSALTLEAWIKGIGIEGDDGIVSKGRASAANSCWSLQGAGGGASNTKVRFLHNDGGASTTDIIGVRIVDDGSWHHIATTLTSSEARLYIDGSLDGVDVTPGTIGNCPGDFYVGYQDWDRGYFNGTIDEIAIWNISLSSQIIAQHSGYGIDKSIYGNNATLMNGSVINFTNAKFGEAMEFYKDEVRIPTRNLNHTKGALEFWFKIRSNTNRQLYPFAFSRNADGTSTEFDVILEQRTVSANGLSTNLYVDGTEKWSIFVNVSQFETRTNFDWNHFAVVQDGISPRLYLNGVQVGKFLVQTSVTDWLDDIFSSASPADAATIGGYRTNGAAPSSLAFNGTIDEVAVWNISLSADKIAEHAGAKITDYSQYGNNGTRRFNSTSDFGRNFTDGKFSKALLFDGVNDYVNVSNESNFDFERTNSLSIEAWIKRKQTGAFSETIVVKGDPPNGYLFRVDTNDILQFQIGNSGANLIAVSTTSAAVPDTDWHHVIVTYNGSGAASGVKFYVDGASKGTTTSDDTSTLTALNNDNLLIGKRPDDTPQFFNGTMDEFSIWNISLDSDLIKQHTQRGLTNLSIFYSASNDSTAWSDWTRATNNTLTATNTLSRYFRYLAKFNTSNSNLTPILNDVTINYTGIFTDSFGSYNYTLTAPTTAAAYTIKANSTWDNIISGEALQPLTVRDLTCTCPASGDWGINVADNCVITSDCNMQGSNVYVYGSGTLTINALIYNFNRFASHGSTIVCVRQAGCFG